MAWFFCQRLINIPKFHFKSSKMRKLPHVCHFGPHDISLSWPQVFALLSDLASAATWESACETSGSWVCSSHHHFMLNTLQQPILWSQLQIWSKMWFQRTRDVVFIGFIHGFSPHIHHGFWDPARFSGRLGGCSGDNCCPSGYYWWGASDTRDQLNPREKTRRGRYNMQLHQTWNHLYMYVHTHRERERYIYINK